MSDAQSLDPFFHERMLLAADRGMEGQTFDDQEAVNAFLENELVGHTPEELAEKYPMTDAQKAGDKALWALAEEDRTRSLALAQEALALDPECIDALALVAAQEEDPAARAEALEALVVRTREARKAAEEEAPGQLWDYVTARPTMRLLASAAAAALEAERPHAAADLAGEALDLDADDRLGILPVRLAALAMQGRWAKAYEESREWDLRGDAFLLWLSVLLAHQSVGVGAAFQLLKKARKAAPRVEALLTGLTPVGTDIDHELLQALAPLWSSAPTALAWLKGRPGR